MVGYPQTTFQPVTEFGRLLNHLFANTFWWTIWILVVVEIAILYVVIKYRDRPDAPTPKQIHGHTGIEIVWTIIPAIVVLFIAVPTIRGVFATQPDPPKNALVVKVIGHQWWWEFQYPELNVTTANELILPVFRDIDLQLHSADVVHSFWVPRVGGKRDVNPQPMGTTGEKEKINHIQFNIEQAGYYSGQCAEYCGTSHGLMRTAIVAMTKADFDEWAESMKPHAVAPTAVAPTAAASTAAAPTAAARAPVNPTSPTGAPSPGRGIWQDVGPIPPGSAQQSAMMPGQPSLEERGKQIFASKACIACHTLNGTNAQGKIGPNLTRFGIRRSVGAGAALATINNVEQWIHSPRDIKPGALMPGAVEGAGGMPATGLNRDEIRAVAAYLKSLK